MDKARAMVLNKFNEPLELEEFPIPDLKQGEILVKVLAAGVCGSDAHMWRGKDPRTCLPMILGHEGVGEVVEIKGEKKSVLGEKISVGDKILWHRGISCGKCYYCQVLRQPALCKDRWVYGIHRSCGEAPHLLGCYTDYLALDSRCDLFIIPSDAPAEAFVSATCSGSTTAHGFDLAPPSPGDTVVIQGPGPLGIYAVAFAKQFGAKEIIVIGGTEARLSMCLEFGATKVLNRKKSTLEERKEIILEATQGRGADSVFELVGNTSAVREGLDLVRIGGSYVSAGFGEPNGTIQLDCFQDIVRKNLRYQGVWVSDTKHTYWAYQMVCSNVELFNKLVTHKYPLEDANQALKDMEAKKVVKAVLIPQAI